jgi:cytidine deaminase
MTDRHKQFEKALNDFPEPVQKILQTIPGQAGRLSTPQCMELMTQLKIDTDELMTRLLPLAKIYAVVPVSQFKVGAVARADSRSNEGGFDLFLGANLEFRQQPLNQSIHAEQSATMNAWQQDAGYLKAIAASEASCGHCRQFFYEFEKNADLMVITPHKKNRAYRRRALSDLLPEAFGPQNLANQDGLMSSLLTDHRMRPIPGIMRAAQFRSKTKKFSAAVLRNPRPSIPA